MNSRLNFSDKPTKGWWSAPATLRGHKVKLDIDKSHPRPELQSLADAALQRIDHDWKRAQDNLARSLLANYNDVWAPEVGDPPLKKPDFLARLTPRFILIHDDKGVTLVFDDADLFGGHDVQLTWDADGKLQDAELIG